MAKLDGMVALVTGAKVAVLVRDRAGGEAVVEAIRAAGGTAISVVCDVGDSARIPFAVAEIVDAFGTVDILVNNAFDASTISASVAEAKREIIESQFNTGFFATLAFMQAVYPHMQKRGGRIINLGSPAAMAAVPGYLPYTASKEAIRALSRTAAREWGGRNIRVNVLCPIALTDAMRSTVPAGEEPPVPPQMVLRRIGSPETDIAPVALFLASDDSAYISGYTFNADGGFLVDTAR
jgi:NAD(P)-dependent dehydrogenase (short-subunit alcohol dehydrogenase family)